MVGILVGSCPPPINQYANKDNVSRGWGVWWAFRQSLDDVRTELSADPSTVTEISRNCLFAVNFRALSLVRSAWNSSRTLSNYLSLAWYFRFGESLSQTRDFGPNSKRVGLRPFMPYVLFPTVRAANIPHNGRRKTTLNHILWTNNTQIPSSKRLKHNLKSFYWEHIIKIVTFESKEITQIFKL